MSLVTLCLCDQNISVIEGLDMPCLRELYLHRNCIKEIGDGLVGCPKLTKLWLFQNAIKKVSGLSNLSLLEECWLQANKIKKLDGFEYNQNLVYLGVAGNPIQTYGELLKLKHLNNLQELSCNDIHFGRCGIVDVIDGGGYKEFVMCHLPQIHLLDGITITKAIQHQAELLYDAQVKLFNAKLVEIDDSYRKELANIELRRQVLLSSKLEYMKLMLNILLIVGFSL